MVVVQSLLTIVLDFVTLRLSAYSFPYLWLSFVFPLLLDGNLVPCGFGVKTQVFHEFHDYAAIEQVKLLWLTAGPIVSLIVPIAMVGLFDGFTQWLHECLDLSLP